MHDEYRTSITCYEEIFDDYEAEDTLYDGLYWDKMMEKEMKETFNRERNIRRDKKGV